jgi:hypothetical protein
MQASDGLYIRFMPPLSPSTFGLLRQGDQGNGLVTDFSAFFWTQFPLTQGSGPAQGRWLQLKERTLR